MLYNTVKEFELELGQNLRALRIRHNLDQQALAAQAGISLNSVKHLENGKGSTLSSLIHVLRVLDRTDWLTSLAPTVSISPLQALKSRALRKRVFRPRGKNNV
ncbi:MAG: helix-turn-helix transcriptional regulator [Fibrobacterota bacterium]